MLLAVSRSDAKIKNGGASILKWARKTQRRKVPRTSSGGWETRTQDPAPDSKELITGGNGYLQLPFPCMRLQVFVGGDLLGLLGQ